MQPTHNSMSRRMRSGTSPRVTTSDTAKRPPGLSTRNASLKTRSLSPDRLMTQLEMMTLTELSGDKDRVLSEAFRVLKPGGRLAVSDVVTRGEVPDLIRRDMLLWVGCIAGALEDTEYAAKLAKAGFEAISIEPTRIYDIEDARAFLAGKGVDVDAIAPQIEGKFMSGFVRAVKPKDREVK